MKIKQITNPDNNMWRSADPPQRAERVAARIGGGGLYVTDQEHRLSDKSGSVFKQSLRQINDRILENNDINCIANGLSSNDKLKIDMNEVPERLQAKLITDYSEFQHTIADAQSIHHNEPDVYFYHSDHLGSASWITDNGGLAVQHLQYLPYGERYVDQRISGYSERFTFTGKERDEETGYGYFGARYMDHELMTMWLSVDPMADKYPSISPYAYCAWNPVKLVDPDGREVVVVGDKIDKILQKLSYQKLDISYNDKTGRLEAKLNNCTVNDLSDDEKMLYSAIMDPNVCVQIASFTAAKDKNGNDCFIDPIDNVTAYGTEGGSFYEGILIKNNETGVSIARTLSYVDVDLMDKNGYDNGVPHEITEGYLVGRKMIERDVSYVGMATQNGNNPIVKEAHAEAVSEKKIKNSINY